MTNADFYKLLAAPYASAKLDHVWQFALMLPRCPDDAAVVALIEANPTLASDYAAQEAVYEALSAPNPLHSSIAGALDDARVLSTISAAPPAIRAEYANDLAFAAYSQDELCARYRELVLGETS